MRRHALGWRVLSVVVLAWSTGIATTGFAQEIGTDPFRRGDINGDQVLDISDPIYLLGSLFAAGPALPCLDAADANDDGAVNVADVTYMLGYMFSVSISTLPPPFPGPSTDPTLDRIVCGCATAAQIEALAQSIPIPPACVPSFTVSLGITNATICTGSPPVCSGSNGCTANVSVSTATYNASNQQLTVTGTISAPSVPVNAGIFGSCNGAFSSNFTVVITTTSVVLQPAARRITSYNANATLTNPQISGCGLLGSALNLAVGLFASQIEQEIETEVEAAANSLLDNLVVCTP
ncbi:MAG: hypothetical protein AB7O52_11170 [Planctomycetota bacterium]